MRLLLLATAAKAHVDVASPGSPPPVESVVQELVLDGNTATFEFDGHGGLSAGASSRQLIDYPEPQRSDILDLLFSPGVGAALQVLKVEIGGDTQSTDGTEPSHQHSRDDLGCARGYEGWLAREATKRNPAIKVWSLSWGVPGWIGNGSYFSYDNIAYQVRHSHGRRAVGWRRQR